MFGKLRVWDTEHNNGVLIYLLLAEHAIEIVADRGLDRHVDAGRVGSAIAGACATAFHAGRFEDGSERRRSMRSTRCWSSTSRWRRARRTRTSCPTRPMLR